MEETLTATPFSPVDTALPAATDTDTLEPTRTPSPSPTETETAPPAFTETPSVPPTETPTDLPYASGPILIGTSVAGRPIEAFRFGTGPVERLIIHGIHGGSEYNTIVLADQLIAFYTTHPDVIPDDVTLYIVRNLNPDGEARGHTMAGRPNDHNVDLNRNWNYLWKADWDRTGCTSQRPINGGAYPLSEPESQALWRLITSRHFSAFIDFHSAGLGILPGGQPLDPESVRLSDALAAVSDYLYPSWNTGCEYTGQLTDWTASIGIASTIIELTDHTNTDYGQILTVMNAFLNWE